MDLEQIEKPDQTDPQKAPARLLEKYQALASQVQPLSYNQRALWVVQQIEPENVSYNLGVILHLVSTVDIQALREAFQTIVDRHAPLRTLYDSVDGEPFQIVFDRQEVDFISIDAARWTDDDLAQCLHDNLNQPFDLTNDRLFRVRLYSHSANKYTLQVLTHHISADDWSVWLLIREGEQAYEARQSNQPIPWKPLQYQYSDFVQWQSEMLTQKGEQLWSYWRDTLEGGLSASQILPDHNPTLHQQPAGASYQFDFPQDVAGKLRHLAREEGTTLYTILLAAFQIFLWRYSNQEEILISTPVLGRSDRRFMQQCGYFVNTAVMRSHIDPRQSFRDHLRTTHDKVQSALAHADFPFAWLVERLQPARSAQQPLTHALFNFLRPPRDLKELVSLSLAQTDPEPITLGALIISGLEVVTGRHMEDLGLNLFVLDLKDRLIGDFKYSANRHTRETIVRMADHFLALLADIAAHPDRLVAELSLIPASERRLLAAWNETAVPYPDNACLHHLFEAQVKRTPEATAVSFANHSLTYDQLNRQANQLARHLQKLGVGPGDLIGVNLDRSLEMVVALFAVHKTGAAYIPLDPAFPQERLDFMLADSQARLLLTHTSLLPDRPDDTGLMYVCLDRDAALIAQNDDHNLPPSATANDLAYVIYTSGSTGKPKGVQIEQRSAVNFLHAMRRQPGLAPEDVLLSVTTLSFDIAVLEIFLPLLNGAQVVLVDRETAVNAQALIAALQHTDPTLMQATPTTWRMLLEAGWAGSPRLKLLCGGEALSRELADQLLPRCGELWNLYGPTETTVWSAVQRVQPGGGPITLGRPIDNTTFTIVDQAQRPLPIGVPGELLIGGDGLARGYLHRPELTAEKFISIDDLPSATRHSPLATRLYRTGDLARFLPDGSLEFLGRLDNQVKIRGYRIELGEIETHLAAHPAVREAVVVVQTFGPDDRRLVGYYIPQDSGREVASHELRGYLRGLLPDYMVPAALLPLPALPLTPNRKIDRRALPLPSDLDSPAPQEFISPTTPLEKTITGIWRTVLGSGQIGVHDNFFELGGHSLLATQIVARIRQTTQVELPIRAIFEAPTVAGMAQRVAALQTNDSSGAKRPLLPADRNTPLPLSFSQERMWFLHQLDPDGTAYNIPAVVRLKGALDSAALAWSINQIVARHESLRTRFTAVDGQPTALIEPDYHYTVSIVDYRARPPGERLPAALNACQEAARIPFQLDQLPLFQIKVFQLDDQEYLLFIVMHHIISDQWSLGVFARDLTVYYRAFALRQEPDLPDMLIQAGDYAVWQRQLAADGAFTDQMHYWKKQLDGLTAIDLPADRPRPALQTSNGAILTSPLPPGMLDALQTLSAQESVSPFMILLAGFKLLLSRYSGVDDIAVGSPIANRQQFASETLISTLVNTLVLRTDLSGNPTFRQLLRRVQQMALDAYAHQDLPFERLVEALQPARDTSRSPLFQAFFNVQNAPFALPDLPQVTSMAVLMVDRGAAQFDLSLSVDMSVSRTAVLEYNTDLFDAGRMERLLGHLWELLTTAVADPDRPIAGLPLLTAAEMQQLNAWNETAVPYPQDACLHHLFEAQVERTPEATAVTFANRSLTYAQLNRQANQLARHLQTLGVGPGDLIGVNLDRSLEMVVALFAVHKTGAAYIPLDPAFPQERLDFMLADSQARLLLTHTSLLPDRPDDTGLVYVCLDRDAARIAQNDDHNLPASATANDLAYVIYTSGSTGKPKGVQIEQRSAVNFLHAMRRQPGLAPDDVLLSVTTLSFDIAVLEIFLPLLNGAQVVLVDRETAVNAQALMTTLQQADATLMQATPTTWSMLLEAGWAGSPRLKLLCGGEALSRELADQLLPRCGELWNLYGPTETTVWSAVQRVQPGSGPITLGRPIDNTNFTIVDQAQRPLPIGVPGELLIGGDGLARGYLNRPELTAEKFISTDDLPLVTRHSPLATRLYRTGDLARFLPDGSLEFLGRLDNQVKIRGYRIELGEIETHLAAHPAVREAVVVVQTFGPDDRRLVGYYIPQDSGREAASYELRGYLRGLLPDYMVPAALLPLPAFPLTPNRKIDRRALPLPSDLDSWAAPGLMSMPQDTLERQIIHIWERVLGLSGIGRYDNFFDLGGHSLLGIRVFAAIQDLTQVELPLTTLFRAPTPAKLAEILRSAGWQTDWQSLVPIQEKGSRPPFYHVAPFLISVLSFSQLAQDIGADQPFYGLQPQGLDGVHAPHERIEDMAAHYIQEIRSLQPTGPYLLGGHCAGNWVAFEMARQLQMQGEEVAFLVLVDSEPPNIEPPRISPWRCYLNRLLFYWRDGRLWPAFQWKLGLAYQQFIASRIGSAEVRHAVNVRMAHREAFRQYHAAGQVSGDVLFIRSHESALMPDKTWHLRWSELITGKLRHEEVPGTHAMLLEDPNVQVMAAQIRAAIDEAIDAAV